MKKAAAVLILVALAAWCRAWVLVQESNGTGKDGLHEVVPRDKSAAGGGSDDSAARDNNSTDNGEFDREAYKREIEDKIDEALEKPLEKPLDKAEVDRASKPVGDQKAQFRLSDRGGDLECSCDGGVTWTQLRWRPQDEPGLAIWTGAVLGDENRVVTPLENTKGERFLVAKGISLHTPANKWEGRSPWQGVFLYVMRWDEENRELVAAGPKQELAMASLDTLRMVGDTLRCGGKANRYLDDFMMPQRVHSMEFDSNDGGKTWECVLSVAEDGTVLSKSQGYRKE